MSSFPLSPLQESRWRLGQAERAFPWAASLTLGLHGPLELAKLCAALDGLVRRHEILRTRFVREAPVGPARMHVAEAGEVRLTTLDWSTKTLVERERECRKIERALRTTLDEDGSTPLHAALARLTDDEHVLVLAQSALAADWRSLWFLGGELIRSLSGAREGEPPVQFADLAQWLRETHASEDGPAGREAWRGFDPAAAAALRLPLEFDRGPRAFAPVEIARELSPRLLDLLRRFAESKRFPTGSVLCAAWQAWLARMAELEMPVIGARSSGRAFQGLDQALGPFERFLPAQARLDERTSLAQLARKTDEQLARGAEWHEFFEPERLGAPADFAFRYAFEHLPCEEPQEHGDYRLEILRRDGHGEAFRGLLRAEESQEGCELRFAFDARFHGEADAAAVVEPYMALLESALARPDAPLASLSACAPAQRARILALARGPALARATEMDGERCVHEWILETARARPEAAATSANGVTLSYRELEQRSAALAAELETRGVGPGTRVGIHLERSVELVVALLAVLRAGGAYVPLPPSYPRERVLGMLADSRARVVIGGTASETALTSWRGTLVLAHAARSPRAFEPRAFEPRARATPADLAYVIYTSGSTGKPKGVPITHANLMHSTRARVSAYAGRVQSYLLLSSFAFDSSVAGIFWTLVQGGTLVLPPEGFEQDLAALPALIARHRVTHLLGLPSLWSLLLESGRTDELATLRTVIVAGESCPPELPRRHRATLPDAKLYNEYGPTEGTVWSSVFDTEQPCERPQVPIGRPIPGSSSYVLTPQRELAPIGMAGDLWIGGPGVAWGYLEQPELTAERFADDPFSGGRMYKTGDRARLLPDGNLEYLGRADNQVKIRGYRIELEEIEAALATHPAVREAVVLARVPAGDAQRETSGAQRETRLVAYILPIGPRPVETDLLRYLAARLPEYMVPGRAVCLEAWPRLPNGKVDRKALPEPEEALGFVEPTGVLEVVLAALWADVLGCERVGRHDDFFALGGHSLSVTRLYARLKETLQITLPLRALFEHRTPAALAAELGRDPRERARVERLAELVLSVLEAEPVFESEEGHALGA